MKRLILSIALASAALAGAPVTDAFTESADAAPPRSKSAVRIRNLPATWGFYNLETFSFPFRSADRPCRLPGTGTDRSRHCRQRAGGAAGAAHRRAGEVRRRPYFHAGSGLERRSAARRRLPGHAADRRAALRPRRPSPDPDRHRRRRYCCNTPQRARNTEDTDAAHTGFTSNRRQPPGRSSGSPPPPSSPLERP